MVQCVSTLVIYVHTLFLIGIVIKVWLLEIIIKTMSTTLLSYLMCLMGPNCGALSTNIFFSFCLHSNQGVAT